MRRLALLAVTAAIASVAWGGENLFLGTITSVGSSKTNVTTATPFAIPAGSKVTLYCTNTSNVLVDNYSTSATVTSSVYGLPVSATTLFPTSVGANRSRIAPVPYANLPDGGTDGGTDGGFGIPTAIIAVYSADGGCSVWQRSGTE